MNLDREYKKHTLNEYNGIPSKDAIDEIINHFTGYSKTQKIDIILQYLKGPRELPIERQIYSTYKAASYYMNMAKDKFNLINKENQLTSSGKELISIRTGFFTYSNTEKLFYFKQILHSDFHLFLSLCHFLKLSKKYNHKDYVSLQFDFLDKCYNIKHFNFTSISLDNYNIVRNFWINILNVLDSRTLIRQKYIKKINENLLLSDLYSDLTAKVSEYEHNYFKPNKTLFINKNKLLKLYNKCVKEGKEELGFVNLYDIKDNMRMSHEKFSQLINKFYEQEKGKKHVFFSNIVNSIDRRKRFSVRGVSVLKIKIK